MSESEIPKLRRYFLDTEFLELLDRDPALFSVISLALLPEDMVRKGLYFISRDFDPSWVPPGHDVEGKILPHLEPESEVPRSSKEQIKNGILKFIQPAEIIEIWHYKAKGDITALRHVFNGELEHHFRAWELGQLVIRDMDVYQRTVCAVHLPEHMQSKRHHPSNDAAWLRDCVSHLESLESQRAADNGRVTVVPGTFGPPPQPPEM